MYQANLLRRAAKRFRVRRQLRRRVAAFANLFPVSIKRDIKSGKTNSFPPTLAARNGRCTHTIHVSCSPLLSATVILRAPQLESTNGTRRVNWSPPQLLWETARI